MKNVLRIVLLTGTAALSANALMAAQTTLP